MCKMIFDGGDDDKKQPDEPGQPAATEETERAGRDADGFTRELEEKGAN